MGKGYVQKDPLFDVLKEDDSKKTKKRKDDDFTSSAIFNSYKEKSEIVKNILEEIGKTNKSNDGSKRYYSLVDDNNKPLGFFSSVGNENEIGVITHCQTISLFVSLFENSYESIENVWPYEDKILFAFNEILKAIEFDKCKIIKNKSNKCNFTYAASPFLDASTNNVKDYVDTMAKVLTAACDFRFYLIVSKNHGHVIDNVDELIKDCEKIICGTMADLTNAAIEYEGEPLYFTLFGDPAYLDTLSEEEREKYLINYIGWNFLSSHREGNTYTSKAYDMSLYYTYSVCRAYITFSHYFAFNINLQRERRDFSSRIDVASKLDQQSNGFEDRKKEYLNSLKDNQRDLYEMNKDFFTFEVFTNYFFPFSKIVLHAGRYVDIKLSQIDISSGFVGNNFTYVDFDSVETSSSDESLFNTLFSMAILFYAGLDKDYLSYFGDEKEEQGREDQETFFSDINFALTNIQRCLSKLKKEKREYIVDQKIISVSEKIPLLDEYFVSNARKIRKRKIQAITISPLLIRVHSEISRYLIKFPEKGMESYLRQIVENRSKDEKGNYVWAWDGDGYDLNLTLNYVESLSDFFEYYDHYERDFIGKQKDIEKAQAAIYNHYDKKIKEKDDLITSLTEQIEVEKNKKPDIVVAIEKFLCEYMSENILDILGNALVKTAMEDSLNNNDVKSNFKFYDAVKTFIASSTFQLLRTKTDTKSKMIVLNDVETNKSKLNEARAKELINAFKNQLDSDLVEFVEKADTNYADKQED